MKGIKAILGIALATTGLGGAIAVGAVSTQTNRVEQAVAGNTAFSIKGTPDSWASHTMTDYGSPSLMATSSWGYYYGGVAANHEFYITDGNGNNQSSLWKGEGAKGDKSNFSMNGNNLKCNVAGNYYFYVAQGIYSYGNWSYGVGVEVAPTNISLIGSFAGSNWSTDVDMTINYSAHTATYTGLSLIKNDTFKIRKNHDYSKGEWGSSNVTSSDFVTECIGSDGSNIKALHDGTYNITIDFLNNSITITGERAPQDSEDIHVVHLYTASTDSWSDESVSLKAGSSTEYTGQFTFGIGDKFKFNIANSWYGYSNVKSGNELTGEHNYFYEDNDHNILVNVAGTYTLYMDLASNTFGIWLQKDSVDGIANSKEFAKQFNTTISGICDINGVDTDVSALNTAWTAQATLFGQQVSEVQSYLKAATSSNADSDIAAFIAKYTSVYTLRGKSLTSGDFLQKGISPTGSNVINSVSKTSNASATIVIMIACLAISATGLFILLRKKHN